MQATPASYHCGGRFTVNASASITITPVFVADLHVEGERIPVYVHVIDHPDARRLVDTGMTELHPAVADDIVVNTHLHFDHRGGNHLFAGRPIYVQRRELDDARSEDDYTIRPGSTHSACDMCRWTASSSCCLGCGLSRRRATHAAFRWSSSEASTSRNLRLHLRQGAECNQEDR